MSVEKIGNNKPRVIVTTDGEIDDECSMVRFLLYTNGFDVEGIITTSSQYHWHGHRWTGDDWVDLYIEAYSKVYPNLLQHDKKYPSPKYLKSISSLGNVESKGEMDFITPGFQYIVKVLLDETDNRPIWLLAWGGINTIARALKSIEQEHPEKMEYVANKLRFFFIWEQDSTYQSYIRPHWGKYNILTIISDQFLTIAYQWNKILPEDKQVYFKVDWMKSHILEGHGELCSLSKAHTLVSEGLKGDTSFTAGDFRSEGDSPSFLHIINTGLRNLESPDYGGWGGRYIKVRENTWLDPVPFPDYKYPEGRYNTLTAWGRKYMREEYPKNQELMKEYFKPLTRWVKAIQKDFAAKADWCVKSNNEANHLPIVKLNHNLNLATKPGSNIKLSVQVTYDPNDDEIIYNWWYYKEPSDYKGDIEIENYNSRDAKLIISNDIKTEIKLHIICEVTDKSTPHLPGINV